MNEIALKELIAVASKASKKKKYMNITLTELIDSGFSKEKMTSWAKFKQAKGDNVIFWGSTEEGTRNIDAVKHQKLPVTIEIDFPEDCVATEYEKSEYCASISIPEHTWIQINPEC